MERDMERTGRVPKPKPGGEGEEHWLESLVHGRRGLDPEDVDELHDLDKDDDVLDAEDEAFQDEKEDDEDLDR